MQPLEQAMQQAHSRYEAGRSSLYRPDGQPKYSEPEVAERLQKLQAEREEALRPHVAAAEKDAARYTRELQAVEGTDPAAALSTEDLTRAAALRPFVAEFLEDSRPGEVVDRLRSVVESKDRASAYAHAQAIERKLRAEDARGASLGPMQLRHRETTFELLDELRGLLNASGAEHEERREEARRKLQEAEKRAQQARLATTGSSSLYQHVYRR